MDTVKYRFAKRQKRFTKCFHLNVTTSNDLENLSSVFLRIDFFLFFSHPSYYALPQILSQLSSV